MERLRRSPRERANDPRPERWAKLVLLGSLLVVVVAAAGWFGYHLLTDEGEILHFSSEPMPGQSGRIARMSIVRIDDAEEFRARVNQETRVIMIEHGREAELGHDWVSEQYQQGIVIVRLDRNVRGTDWRGREILQGSMAFRSCRHPGVGGGGTLQWHDWQIVKLSLESTLTRHENLRCE